MTVVLYTTESVKVIEDVRSVGENWDGNIEIKVREGESIVPGWTFVKLEVVK